jgi:hypothetical protein
VHCSLLSFGEKSHKNDAATTFVSPVCCVRVLCIRLCLILGSAPVAATSSATDPGSPGHAALPTAAAGPGHTVSVAASGSESPSTGSEGGSDLHLSAGEGPPTLGAGQIGLGLGDGQPTAAATPVCFSLLEMRSFMPLAFEGLGFNAAHTMGLDGHALQAMPKQNQS